jgi:hypothetical protein
VTIDTFGLQAASVDAVTCVNNLYMLNIHMAEHNFDHAIAYTV